MKKVMTLIMFALLIIVAIPCMSNAAEEPTIINGVAYKVLNETEKTAEVVSPGTTQAGVHNFTEITVEGSVTINGKTYTVKRIGEGAFRNYYSSELKKITIKSGVTTIGKDAFKDNLQEIVLPNTLTTLEEHAIGWIKIENLKLPSSLRTIGKEAFSGSEIKNLTKWYNSNRRKSFCKL